MKCAKEDETLKEGKAFAVVKEHLDMDEEMKPLCQFFALVAKEGGACGV